MRSISSDAYTAKEEAREKGIAPRWLVWIVARDRGTGADVEYGFWSGDWTVDISVLSGATGAPVSRQYVGGVNLVVGDIPRRADNNYAPVEVTMSAIAPQVQNMVRGDDVRVASVEIHSVDLDPETRIPVDHALVEFLGIADGSPIETGGVGGESLLKIKVIDEVAVMLARTNPGKRSHERQQRRNDDQFARHTNSVRLVEVQWGE